MQVDSSNLSPIAAGREVLTKVATFLQNRESFAIETTLSGKELH